jgi:hypothetical protein
MKYDEIVLNLLNGNTCDQYSNTFLNKNYEIINKDIISQSDFIDKDYLFHNFDLLLSSKPNFLLRLYSISIWKKVYSHF